MKTIRCDKPAACRLTWECRSCGERWRDTDECEWCVKACDHLLVGSDGEALAVIARHGQRVAYRRRCDDPENLSPDHPLIYRASLDDFSRGEREFYEDCVRKGQLR